MNQLVTYIEQRLEGVYPQQERHDLALWAAEELTGLSRTELLWGCKDTKIIPNLEIIVERLRRKEPVQYIFGHTQWLGLDLLVTPETLIPRPETAELVEQVATDMRAYATTPLRLLDIGTGSGCIAIALAKAFGAWQVEAIDRSEGALSVAQENARRCGAEVAFRQADILTADIGDYDLIVSNPPYICEQERAAMDANVLDYEPATALFVPDSDPLLFYRRIAALGHGRLYFEVNERYAHEVAETMAHIGYTNIKITKDIYGKERMVSGQRG